MSDQGPYPPKDGNQNTNQPGSPSSGGQPSQSGNPYPPQGQQQPPQPQAPQGGNPYPPQGQPTPGYQPPLPPQGAQPGNPYGQPGTGYVPPGAGPGQPGGYFGAPEESRKKAPTFLLVLCILTFVGSGWGVLGGLIGLLNDPNDDIMEAQKAMSSELTDDPFGGFLVDTLDYAVAVADNFYLINGLSILLAAMSVLGAFFMLKLKKAGFFLYTGANLMLAFVPYLAIVNSVSNMAVIFALIISILFIVLYGLNLKHMK